MAKLDEAEGQVWRGTTAAERIAPRRQRLIDAGFELLGDPESGGISVRGVCARAQLNPRYFYESFDDLDALVVAVYRHIIAETNATTLPAILAAPNSAQAKTHAAIDTAIRFLVADPRRLRIILDAGNTSVALAQRRSAAIAKTAADMAGHASRFYGIPADDKLLRSTTIMLTAGIGELIVAWHNGTIELTIEELVDQCTTLIVGTSKAAGRIARGAQV